MNKLLAFFYNEPLLMDATWLETTIKLLSTSTEDIKGLKVTRTDPLPNTYKAEQTGSVAYIPLFGPIFPRPNMLTKYFGIGTALDRFASDIQSAISNPSVESIVLDIDSPGGSVTGVNEAANIIKSARGNKSITAYVGGTGASAAYWIASAAENVVMDATARVGSIGVVVAYPKSGDDGYVEIVSTASPNKRPDPSSEQGRSVITKELDALASVFINTVAENRGVSTSTVMNDFGKGGVLVGQAAVTVGMADRLGSLEELLSDDNNFYNMQGDRSMDLVELQTKHKALYDSVVQTAQESVQAAVAVSLAEKDAQIAAKEKEIADLKVETSTKTEALSALETRMNSIEKAEVLREKAETIRVARDNQEKAKLISEGLLGASNLPQKFHEKVTKQVNADSFIVDNVLDTEKYKAALNAEIKDWETQLESFTPVQGIGGAPRTVADPSTEAADDATVDRLLGYVTTKKGE